MAVGTSVGWGSLVVTSNTYLAQSGPWGSTLGMIIGGLATFTLIDNADWTSFLDPAICFDVIWIILIATVGAFLCFNVGLKYVTPEEASVTATTEPAASVVISFFVFGTVFGSIELIGIALVIVAILCPTFIRR